MQAAEAGWPAWLPSRLVNLGLDLRGGAHVLVEVETADVYAERLESFWPTLRDKLRDLRDTVGTVRRLDDPGRAPRPHRQPRGHGRGDPGGARTPRRRSSR